MADTGRSSPLALAASRSSSSCSLIACRQVWVSISIVVS